MSPIQVCEPAAPSATVAHRSAAAGEATAPSARPAADGALRAVCAAAADYDRASGWTQPPPGPAVVAALAGAVRTYAEQCRGGQLPPERVLARLKQAVADCAPRAGYSRDGQAVRDVVFTAFLAAYFPGAAPRRRPPRVGPLSPAQWATLGEPG